jgi:hypothetical protein
MHTSNQSLSISSNIQFRDDICCLERDRATGQQFDDPTPLFLEPLGTEVWRMRVSAGQLSLPSYRQ